MTAKEKHKAAILEYIGNPENDFPDRVTIATKVLGFKKRQTLYAHFTVEELNQIEVEALDLRRKKYAAALAMVDRGLLKKAAEGDAGAAKLVYQKFEGWAETKRNEHSGKDGGPIEHNHGLSAEAKALLDEVYGSKGGE